MAMVVILLAMVAAAAVGGLALAVWWAAETIWFRPRRLERALMAQGLIGSRYQFPSGDLKKHRELVVEARQKPIPLSHRIIPRAAPQLIHNWELCGGEVDELEIRVLRGYAILVKLAEEKTLEDNHRMDKNHPDN
ncbi:hypothetical protein HPP92_023273 [Vanilla planifolia]|uniref:Uncharacterized protein n=1 Tax=Vanilla planifolia TaxID=51239 RepID=A0A835PTI0_VANPL|nr:hypothetical protein HPP92_023273 [Vanilla planifolia]